MFLYTYYHAGAGAIWLKPACHWMYKDVYLKDRKSSHFSVPLFNTELRHADTVQLSWGCQMIVGGRQKKREKKNRKRWGLNRNWEKNGSPREPIHEPRPAGSRIPFCQGESMKFESPHETLAERGCSRVYVETNHGPRRESHPPLTSVNALTFHRETGFPRWKRRATLEIAITQGNVPSAVQGTFFQKRTISMRNTVERSNYKRRNSFVCIRADQSLRSILNKLCVPGESDGLQQVILLLSAGWIANGNTPVFVKSVKLGKARELLLGGWYKIIKRCLREIIIESTFQKSDDHWDTLI